MNILVYSHTPLWEEQHAQTIEICLKHLKLNDNVIILSCDSSLDGCPANIKKNINLCNKCIKQKVRTKNIILENKVKHIELEFQNINNDLKIKSLDEFTNYKFENVPFGQIVLSTLITDDFKSSYFNFEDIKKINGLEKLNTSINLYHRVKSIIKEHNIDRLYVWNGRRSSDATVNYAAKNLNIEFFSYISGGMKGKYQIEPTISTLDIESYKKLMEKFYETHKENNTLSEFEEEGLKHFHFLKDGKNDGKAYGLKQFSINFDKKNTFIEKNRKKNIAIFPGSNWEYLGFSQGLNKINDKDFNQYDFLEKILKDKFIKDNFNLYVRWHPFLGQAGLKEKIKINEITNKYSHVNFYSPESKVNSYNLLDFSNIVISFGSTIGVEATLYGKPSILFGRTFWEDSGAAYKVSNLDDLSSILKKDTLPPKPYINALKEGYYQRHRGRETYKHIRFDNEQRCYLNKKRIKNITSLNKIFEKIKIVIKSNDKLYKFIYIYLLNKIKKKYYK